MKLAFCLFNYFPYGGLQRDFLRIAQVCRNRGHEIQVYTMQWDGDREPGFAIQQLSVAGVQNHTRAWAFSQELSQVLAEESHDVVIGFNKMPNLDIYYAADVCYQARIRASRSYWYRLLPRYRRWVELEKSVFEKGQKTEIFLIAPTQQQDYITYYHTEPNRFHLLPPGISKDRLAPENASEIRTMLRKTYQIREDEKIILFIGSGFKTKGLDRAIKALGALPADLKAHTHFFVLGQDNPTPFLSLAKTLHVSDRLHFLGGRDDVPAWLLAGDLLIHPAYHENTGTVLLEAMVSGLPILTVDYCGYAHYVKRAGAGIVLDAPFQQSVLNQTLEMMLLSQDALYWRNQGLAFAKAEDLYSLPEKAADLIEEIGQKKRDALSTPHT